MENPIHTHLTSYYLVLRPILWFPAGAKITQDKMNEYFTQKAVKSLLEYEFIITKRP